jgi:hypothetical protein
MPEIRFAKDNLVLALPGNNETSGEVARSYADILAYGPPDTLQRGERSGSKLGRCQHSRGAAAAGTPGTYVVDQRGRFVGVCADLSDVGTSFPGPARHAGAFQEGESHRSVTCSLDASLNRCEMEH